ncbi:acyltransferase family protein [Legionella sp. D16C41]|uniref:acyltransferase family protein n=1 Tax=Legionella sp. D16C41 TaxID=3402688 RepID=UPI003AF9A037
MPNNPPRLLSLDVFRGIIVAMMIIVNSPGKYPTYSWLAHSSWNGCTLADLIFPWFIFIAGVSCVFQLSSLKEQLPFNVLVIKIIKRSIIIFAIGLLLNAFPYHFDLNSLRFYGVLQRIAICYFFAAILFLTTKVYTQFFIFILLLVSYWLINLVLPGYTGDSLTPEFNIPALIDRALFSEAHLYGKYYDPEGLLSTISSLATVLLGNLAGYWLVGAYQKNLKLLGLITAGFLGILLGWLWSFWFPINKSLWTSSYVLWTGGLGLFAFAICYWFLEIKQWQKWIYPFKVFGLNALFAYTLHIFLLKIQIVISIPHNGKTSNLKTFLTENLFSYSSAENASLSYAIIYTIVCLILTIITQKLSFFKLKSQRYLKN